MHGVSSSLTIASLLVAVACAGSPTAPDPPLKDLINAPTSVAIAGTNLTLAASLWRDFMPIVPPGGRPLTGTARLIAAGGSPIPGSVQISGAWVVRGEEVWTATGAMERQPNPGAYEVALRAGPAWAPATTVDVIVELSAGNERVLLRQRAVSIDAVY